MNKTKHILSLLVISLSLTGCLNPMEKKTTLEIVDNYRHYYPILRGQEIEMAFTVKNVGKNPFVLTDAYTSCGCLIVEKTSVHSIPPGRERNVILKYNSAKNIGYVKQYVTLFGNLSGADNIEIVFDVHVVPNSLYTKDYEELYLDDGGRFNQLVDGSHKGYYMDGDF